MTERNDEYKHLRARANQRIAWEKNTPSIVQFITNAT